MVPGGGAVPTMQRIPLPGAEMLEEEPLYVNAKQYHRILKRRQARAKLEAEGKIPKERRVKRTFSFYCLVFFPPVSAAACDFQQTDPFTVAEIPTRVPPPPRHAA